MDVILSCWEWHTLKMYWKSVCRNRAHWWTGTILVWERATFRLGGVVFSKQQTVNHRSLVTLLISIPSIQLDFLLYYLVSVSILILACFFEYCLRIWREYLLSPHLWVLSLSVSLPFTPSLYVPFKICNIIYFSYVYACQGLTAWYWITD